MEMFRLKTYIGFKITGDDVVKGKPDPECYRKAHVHASEEIPGLQASECLVFEDTESGVIAGKNAGMKVVLIPTPCSVMPKETQPDYQINSLLDFTDEILG